MNVLFYVISKKLTNNNSLRSINCFEVYNYFIKTQNSMFVKKSHLNGMEGIFTRERY